jgi:putative CocE/NonD family hydrolase
MPCWAHACYKGRDTIVLRPFFAPDSHNSQNFSTHLQHNPKTLASLKGTFAARNLTTHMLHRFLICALVALPLFSLAQYEPPKDYRATDGSTVSPAPYNWKTDKKYKGYTMRSYYLEMRDGIPIAVDVYLPKSKVKDEKFPTILHQTRYWRSIELKWPYNWFRKNPIGPLGDFMKPVIMQGYAVVVIDSRGSGASGGKRHHPWSKDEVADMTEIVDHIIKQQWSNGIVGAAGASYSGTTSEFLTTVKHPAVKAVVNMYSLFDVYSDNAFTGGMHNAWFTRVWGEANEALDANTLPAHASKAKKFIKGVLPVKEGFKNESGREILERHIRERDNRNVHQGALTMDFRDDVPKNGAAENADQFSPHKRWKAQNESGAAVYSWSGWYDGAYQNAATKRHMTLTNPKNRLILGPWEHGGRWNCGHTNPGPSGFDHIGEVLRFFDHHLKGWDTGIDKEKSVHYFTMVEEKWKSSDEWPPKEASPFAAYFGSGNSLDWNNDFSQHELMKSDLKLWGDSLNILKSRGVQKILDNMKGEGRVSAAEEQQLANYREIETKFNVSLEKLNSIAPKIRELRDNTPAFDILEVDTTLSPGSVTRYESVAGRLKTPLVYPDRSARDSALLVYDSAPLEADMEVTGHPEVLLHLTSSTTDAQVFIYLEDVAPDGSVEYVTEGLFRGIHRKIGTEPPYEMAEPFHTYLRSDAMPLVPGEAAELNFGMLPVSYLFKKGHRVRVAISGADAEHYRNMTKDQPTYTVHRSFAHPSKVVLPVVPR